jgi:anti-sigma regulatory factor (Ser/Thr protein kinase)
MAPRKTAEQARIVKGRITHKGEMRKVCRYSLDPAASSLITVREFIKACLVPYSPIEPHVCDIVFATHEACKNALQHNPEIDSPVDVVCEVFDNSVVVEVSDRGSGFDPGILPPELPDPEALAGRGIFLIYSLMDAVETETGECGTRVKMQKRFKPPLDRQAANS